MSSLICDLRPAAAAHLPDYNALRDAGEPLTLYWPSTAGGHPGVRAVADAAAWELALEDEAIPCIAGAPLPAWLPVAELDRILLVSDATTADQLASGERALAASLLDAGAEEIELVPPGALAELGQSWHSGRRAGTPRLVRGREA